MIRTINSTRNTWFLLIAAAFLAGAVMPRTGGVRQHLTVRIEDFSTLFLLPLWISFYWQRGFARFLLGTLGAIAVIVLSLVFVSKDFQSFWLKFQPMFALWIPATRDLQGIWGSGLAISATLGCRYNNEASWTQVLEVVEFMSDATTVPILLDGDTGYGNFLKEYKATCLFRKADVIISISI